MRNLDNRLSQIDRRWPELMARIHDRALFADVSHDEAVRWFSYFFSVPKYEKGRPSLRSHVIALYDPFAKRSHFPAGLRFSCNTYVGCALQCAYCYIQSYRDYPGMAPYAKSHFPERLRKDFAELDALGLPVAPLHFSNSTDALQEKLEREHGNTLHLLHRLAEDEHKRFAPIRLLTRNPARLVREEYCEALRCLREKIIVQVSIPILDAAAGHVYEPNVPSAADRLRAIHALRQHGIPVSLRIDPLFPRDPCFLAHRSPVSTRSPAAAYYSQQAIERF